MALVDLTQAKAHLRIPVAMTADDADIALKLAQAEAIILQRCATTAYWRPIVATWDVATVPLAVQASILLLLANLHEHRGDDESFGVGGQSDGLWAAIDRLLSLNKDPVLA